MKNRRVVVMVAWACCLASSAASAQTCKPDFSEQDKISKKQLDQWQEVVGATSFMSSVMTDEDITYSALFGRSGDSNFVAILIRKVESSKARVVFETQYRAAKGDRFVFGFKSGDPLSFVATNVLNQAKGATFSDKLVMTVMVSAYVSDNDLAKLREALTTRQIDAVRISLSSGQFDRSVGEKSGKAMMGKFACFYRTLEQRGISLTAASAAQPNVASATANNDDEPKAKPASLTIDQVIKMVVAKLPDDVIVTTIRTSGSKFTLSVDDLIKLKTAGVSDEVIRAMSRQP